MYRFNVAKRLVTGRYEHLFNTEQRFMDPDRAAMLLETLNEKFPHPAFNVTVTYWTNSGEDVTAALTNRAYTGDRRVEPLLDRA